MKDVASTTSARVWLAALSLLTTFGTTACLRDRHVPTTDRGVPSGVPRGTPLAADGSVPPGWLPLDFREGCGFFYAPSAALLPAPIHWEPCAKQAAFRLDCRQMAADWAPSKLYGDAPFFAAGSQVSLGPDGRATMQVTRITGHNVYRLLADADGPVRQAISETNRHCTLDRVSLAAGHVAYSVADDFVTGQLSPYGGGAVGGATFDLLPHTLARHDEKLRTVYAYAAGAQGALENGVRLLSWTDPSSAALVPRSADDAELSATDPIFSGEALFWMASSRAFHRLKVWTARTGTRDFLRAPAGPSEWQAGYADLGTDGHDLVWEYGTDRSDPAQSFRSVALLSAPFTTDPATLRPRVIGHEPAGSFALSPFVVGCGFAAHLTLPPNGNDELHIIELSTGHSWRLPSPPHASWRWLRPLALSCSELFIEVRTPLPNTARIALSSLGKAEN